MCKPATPCASLCPSKSCSRFVHLIGEEHRTPLVIESAPTQPRGTAMAVSLVPAIQVSSDRAGVASEIGSRLLKVGMGAVLMLHLAGCAMSPTAAPSASTASGAPASGTGSGAGAGSGAGSGTGAGAGSGAGSGTGSGAGSGAGSGTGAGAGSGAGSGTGAGAVPTFTVTGATQLRLASSTQFVAKNPDLSSPSVIWSVRQVSGPANGDIGSIAPDGTYTAPSLPTLPSVIAVTAKSAVDPTNSSTLQVQLLNPVPSIASATFSIEPTSSTYRISLLGRDFASGAQVVVNGTALTPAGIQPEQIFVSVPVTALPSGTQVGAMASLAVDNPSPGASASPEVQTLITGPATSVVAAARLLDQMTFGPTASSISHVQQIGLPAAVDEQLAEKVELMPATSWYYGALSDTCKPFFQCEVDGYWAQYAIFGSDQLKQRIAFAQSKIWNVSYFTVPIPEFSYFLNVLAKDSTANYRTLMKDITLSQAMGTYLNMMNSAAAGPGSHADENYARELLQLFTLGPTRLNEDGTQVIDSAGNRVPTYNLAQIQGFAKAFTGWTYANNDCSAPRDFQEIVDSSIPGFTCPMAAVPAQHDTSAKVLLNGDILPAGQTAQQDLDGALDSIFNDSNLPPHVSKLLIQNLVTSIPSPQYVSRIAAVFRDNGHGVRGDMASVVKAILLDPEARQGDDPNAPILGGHLRDPISWTFAGLRALDVTHIGDESGLQAATAIPLYSGEIVHSAPSVFGFYQYDFTVPGTTLNAPEMQLETPETYGGLSIAMDDHFLRPFFYPGAGGSISVDLSSQSRLGALAAQGADSLLDGLNTLFFHGRMTQAMRQVLYANIKDWPSPDDKLRIALYATMMSSQFRVIQ